MEWRLVLRGTPRSKKNSSRIGYVGGKPRIFPSRQYKEYEESVGWQLGKLRGENIASPVNVKCVYYMPTLARVDLVNLLEGTCDVLVRYGVLEDDNSRIVASHDGSCVRYDKENPRVEVTISTKRKEKNDD